MRIFVNSFISLAFGISIIKLYLDGELKLLINPIYDKMVFISGILLCISFFIFLFFLLRNKKSHFHYHYGIKENIFLVLGLIFAMGIMNFIYIKPLSASTAKLRGLSQNISPSFSSVNFGKAPNQKTLIDWVTTFNYGSNPKIYIGQKVNIEGFIILDKSLSENYFYIGKTLVRCCIADAITGVIPVKYDKDKFTPIENDWIKLSGEINEDFVIDKNQSIIKAMEINKIKTPDNPYEY